MYLKSIEINGFKSFSDKVKLDFKKGITSIVGPNGSGKSNILDAILWVLGEQSHKSIRAKEGTDVIFSGGKNKSPKSMAQVALIIDNSDNFLQIGYTEVKIERRIYRSGENEYLINNNRARLKDINELFMDTGIGKNAYSIIGQGKVEQIILSNPKELRNIIEEAAGIKKVKSKKEEAEKNLENVESDVEKIGYIEDEIKASLDPLKEQAEKTKEFLELKESAENKKKRVLKKSIIEKERVQLEVAERLKSDKENIENLEKDFLLKESGLEELNKKREEKSIYIESLEVKNSELREKNEKQSSKSAILKERMENLRREKEEKEVQKQEIEVKLEKKRERVASIESEYSKAADESIKSKDGIVKKKLEFEAVEREVSQLGKSIEEKKKELVNLEIERVKEQNSSETGKKSIKSSENLIERIREEVEAESKIKQEKEEQLKKISKERAAALKLLQEYGEKKSSEKLKYSIAAENIGKSEKELGELNYKLQNKLTRKEALTKLEDANEGFFAGVKEILNLKKNGVHGAFISVVKIPEELENAIQSGAGNSMQDIVVENSDIAKECIEFLKERRLGRASFLPFDTIRPFNPGKIGGAGVIGVASELVEYDKKYEKAVKFVLGNLLVVKDIESAVRVSKEGSFSGTIVSLDGDVMSGRGKITGGEKIKSGISVIFERRREIKNLEEEIVTIRKEVEKKAKEKSENELIIQSSKEKLEQLNSAEQDENRKLKEYEITGEAAEKELKKTVQNLETILYEKEMEEESLKSAKARIDNSSREVQKISDSIEKIKSEIKMFEKEQEEKRKIYEEKNESYSLDRIAAAQVLEKLKSYEEKLSYERVEIEQLTLSFEQISERIAKISGQISGIEGEIKGVNEEQLKIAKELEEHLKLSKVEKETYKELEIAEKSAIIALKELENSVVNEKNSFTKKSEELEKIKIELQFLKEKAEETGGIEEVEPAEDVNREQKEYDKLQKKIEELGAVNLLAIEEFDRVSQKYSFIIEQKEDLVKSRNSLKKLISEIEQEMMEKFFEAYEKIRENFAYMCQEVLNSSDGDIYLTEPENLLETGVELMVKFKNKKYQSLTLLSGGEKSMIAVAFIMAIFMYKPSPFTFFDEIEAALDEANTKKLIKMLKNFTEMSQFMLITHNKETMKESDVLYGVTMNKEIGASKIIAVEI